MDRREPGLLAHVDALIHLLSRLSDNLDVFNGDGSLAEIYLTLIATTPLTGRALLWVLAPSALIAPEPSQDGRAA